MIHFTDQKDSKTKVAIMDTIKLVIQTNLVENKHLTSKLENTKRKLLYLISITIFFFEHLTYKESNIVLFLARVYILHC